MYVPLDHGSTLNQTAVRAAKAQWGVLEKLGEAAGIAEYRDEKVCITEVLENVDEARVQFEVRAPLTVR